MDGNVKAVPLAARQSGSWLNRNVAAMSAASLFSDMSHEAATAILPLFLATINAGAAALGFIEGAADAVASLFKLVAGHLTDRLGHRKPLTVAGYAITGFTKPLFALATTWPQILVLRAAAWLGRGTRGPLRDAMMADSVTPETYGRAFGLHRAMDTTGAIAGPALALLLIHHAVAYRTVFWLTAIPGALAVVAISAVREKRPAANPHMKFWRTVRDLPLPFKSFVAAAGIFGMGNFAPTLLTLRAMQLLTPSMGTTRADFTAVGLYTFHNVLYAALSFPAGWLGDRVSKRHMLGMAYLLFGFLAIGLISRSTSIPYLMLLFGTSGLYTAFVDALEGSYAAELLPAAVRGTGFGVLGTVNGVGDFVSSSVVGVLWSWVSPAVGFGYAAVTGFVGFAVLLATGPLRAARS
jgi:MFS family permease